jgi:DNA repair protein RecN (Recombination protein N)
MLQSIYIKNYALIDELAINFESGFSTITGETGAGKSIILGALALLLGQRADSKLTKNNAKKCIIEAHFNLKKYQLSTFFEDREYEYDEKECILRREIHPSGKSRAFINDTPAPLAHMKELGEQLIDIHSQHQNLLIRHESFQLNLLDTLAENAVLLKKYKTDYNTYLAIAQRKKALQYKAIKDREEEDFLRFQLKQLEEAQLTSEEQTTLEEELSVLSHAEDIKSILFSITQQLQNEEFSLIATLKNCNQQINKLISIFPHANELAERLESSYIELKDIATEIEVQEGNITFDPQRLEFVEQRLNLIYTLQQKHQVDTIEELLKLQLQFKEQLEAIDHIDDKLLALEKTEKEAYQRVLKQAKLLSTTRKKAGEYVAQEMGKRLVNLGMPNANFKVEIETKQTPDNKGIDTITFLFSSNKNAVPKPVASIASGGEIARVMLSMKAMIAGSTQLPTIIFDEIDTGVSGEIADKMALIMKEMSTNMQVISITHLPQIASKGDIHYKVYKEDTENSTHSHICRLNTEERIEEIAHMLSGATLSTAAIENAKALLTQKTTK